MNSKRCPNCKKLIRGDEPHCPYCDIANPGSWWKNNVLIRILENRNNLIYAVISVNAGMFVIALMLNSRLPSLSFNPFHVLAPENRSLFFLGATGTIPIDRYHRYWTLISANYLHGGILHLLFNMFAFRQLGILVAHTYGSYRMTIIYSLGGVIGYWISYRAGITFTIGASAAICALIGAIIYYGLSRGGTYGRVLYTQVGSWALVIFLFGFLVPGINNWGHLGGFFAGAVLGYFLGYQEKYRENLFHKITAVVCVIATIIILAGAVAFGIYYRILTR
jgi:rhomboid protease GluP